MGIEDGALMDWSGNPNKPNLVGHWPFNEGSGSDVYDMTTNLNNGISIGATWSTDTPGVGNMGTITKFINFSNFSRILRNLVRKIKICLS